MNKFLFLVVFLLLISSAQAEYKLQNIKKDVYLFDTASGRVWILNNNMFKPIPFLTAKGKKLLPPTPADDAVNQIILDNRAAKEREKEALIRKLKKLRELQRTDLKKKTAKKENK